ncbi:MAG: DUF5615 family PIN-like protein [Acidobacteriaceae bacterium]|nr:DUF5615 family PIN-like protein [Acidobacteriaceae bacterium]MBV9781572.1 DUF5615 family PIN-like protein [Acidobacteriaceae bacterium]
MKLLFDANLSPKLPSRFKDLFPESAHVFSTGLAKFTSDEIVWTYARLNGFSIVTADADFLRILKERGSPPKVIRIERCDYKTSRVEELLRRNAIRIAELEHSDRNHLVIRNA